MPSFATDLGAGSAGLAYSALLGANAAGAVVGGIVLEGSNWLTPRVRTAFIGAFLWALSLFGFALSGDYLLSLALLFIGGMSQLTYNSMAQTLVQLLAPPELRGRAIGLYSMAASGLRAFSGVSIGLLGAVIGVHWSLGLSTGLLLVSIVLLVLGLRWSSRSAAPRPV